jgi:hypothetical protein
MPTFYTSLALNSFINGLVDKMGSYEGWLDTAVPAQLLYHINGRLDITYRIKRRSGESKMWKI